MKYHQQYYIKNKTKIRKYGLEYYYKNQEKILISLKEFKQSKKGRYKTYKQNAMSRNLNFEITFEEFCLLWQKPCTYCGSEIKTIGLDRINNNEPYYSSNLTPCCTNCNKMKEKMTVKEFLSQCEKITIFNKQGLF